MLRACLSATNQNCRICVFYVECSILLRKLMFVSAKGFDMHACLQKLQSPAAVRLLTGYGFMTICLTRLVLNICNAVFVLKQSTMDVSLDLVQFSNLAVL